MSDGRSMPGPEDWAIVKAIDSDKGEAHVFRMRRAKPPGAHVPKLRTALSIRWPYDAATLFPQGEEKEAILEFERAVDPLAEENGHSELVLVATGKGVKEWLYYVENPSRFMQTLNDLLAAIRPLPIKIEWYDDPEWKIWRETVDALDERQSS